jgi:alpha-tubulin suppressor-like RCC1 family protein
LGDGGAADHSAPVLVGSGYIALSAGNFHSLAVKSDGTLWAWGYNLFGNLGDGTATNRSTPVFVGGGYAAVAGGLFHSLALKIDGSLWAWGNNLYGQLGDGTNASHATPVFVGSGYAAISAGGMHSLALKIDGSLWAWGWNYYGQIGDGTTANHSSPVMVGTGFTAIATIAAGGAHSLALKSDGSLWAWGNNDSGQLGDGTTTGRLSPVKVDTGYAAIAAGSSHSLGIKTDTNLLAWGSGSLGQLGDGTTTASRPYPFLLGSGYSAVAAGNGHSLAIRTDGTLRAWGWNAFGQLGTGLYTDATSPQIVVNDAVTGVLDLDTNVPNDIPPSNIPKIILETRKQGGLTSLTLSANVYFGAIDLGPLTGGSFAAAGSYKVYVAAIVPAGIPGVAAGIYLLAENRGWSFYAGGPLQEYVSNVTLDQTLHYLVSILDRIDLSGLIGTRILVGYGTDDQEMLAAQRYREIYVVQQETTQ